MNGLPKVERDTAYRKRGGSAKWLLLMCGVCKEDLAFYQKDGPGNLFRLYLDRLVDSEGKRPFRNLEETSIQKLSCMACESAIAIPMTYEKDDRPRPALRLIESGVDKTVIHNKGEFQAAGDLDLTRTMASMLLDDWASSQQ